jgi:hypothetical protein
MHKADEPLLLRPWTSPAPLATDLANIGRIFWAPQNVIRDHPAIGEVNVLLKLNGDHFRVHLHDGAIQPITDPIAIDIVITEHLNPIPNLKNILLIWSFSEKQIRQSRLLNG